MPTYTRFYKVIILSVDIFESRIIDEKHFPSLESAESFANTMNQADYISMIVEL